MVQVTGQHSRDKPADSEVLWEQTGQSPRCLGRGEGWWTLQGGAREASRREEERRTFQAEEDAM